mgnify:CR=1 FL=1|jgi:hypothetical protein
MKVDTIECQARFVIWSKEVIDKNEFFEGGEIVTGRWTGKYRLKVTR